MTYMSSNADNPWPDGPALPGRVITVAAIVINVRTSTRGVQFVALRGEIVLAATEWTVDAGAAWRDLDDRLSPLLTGIARRALGGAGDFEVW